MKNSYFRLVKSFEASMWKFFILLFLFLPEFLFAQKENDQQKKQNSIPTQKSSDTIINHLSLQTGKNQFCLILGVTEEEARKYYKDGVLGSEEVFVSVEVMPQFPGGEAALFEYLGRSIVYPQFEKENGIDGTAHIYFVVNKLGKVQSAKVTQGVKYGAGIDAEALRVVKAMPDWKPGMKNGEPVNVQFTLPVKFVLRNSGMSSKDVRFIGDPNFFRDSSLIYSIEQTANFPGGDGKLFDYLVANTKYPEVAKKQRKKGTVYASFIVDTSGKVTNAKVVRGVSPELDVEVLRVINSLPNWTPARNNGELVNMQFTLPFEFILRWGRILRPAGFFHYTARQQAEFKGGFLNYNEFFVKNLRYPLESKATDNLDPTVYISFTVTKIGKVTDAKVLKGVPGFPAFDEEALRVVKLMPYWIPGKNNGVPEDFQVTISINFIYR